MQDDRLDALAGLFEQGDALLRNARAAAQSPAAPGSDASGSVSVTLDEQGRVVAVTVAAGWQRRLGADGLADAVLEAVREASARRLETWGQTWGEAYGAEHVPAAAAPVEFDRDDFQRRLQAAATGPMSSSADRRAALTELLKLAEAVERGIDEVSAGLPATLAATRAGHSPDRHVTVTMTGGAAVTGVRFDRAWLRAAHEINIGRQLTAAFSAAYAAVAAQGVRKLIDDSPLGAVQRATEDPVELAHRLRLTD